MNFAKKNNTPFFCFAFLLRVFNFALLIFVKCPP